MPKYTNSKQCPNIKRGETWYFSGNPAPSWIRNHTAGTDIDKALRSNHCATSLSILSKCFTYRTECFLFPFRDTSTIYSGSAKYSRIHRFILEVGTAEIHPSFWESVHFCWIDPNSQLCAGNHREWRRHNGIHKSRPDIYSESSPILTFRRRSNPAPSSPKTNTVFFPSAICRDDPWMLSLANII